MGNRILLIEDTTELAALITLYLNKEGMEIRPVESGEEALVTLENFQPDLVLLDLNLPGMGGFEFLQIFRKTSQVPVLIISARDSEEDIIQGLGDGADEYITKPFSPKVLVARVQAMLRRASSSSAENIPQEQSVQFGPYTLYFDRYLLTCNGERIPLSSKEFAILAHLVKNPGIPLTAQAIYRDVWGRAYGDISAVAVYVQRLRKKIEEDPSKPKYIENIHGLGYQFNGLERGVR
ncbi:MAG: response regulator transcription factor [Treponema sp.]|nr:response regulator transcription factor [Spirochaetaceae bacterium]MEE0133306.1 response regulator transcription factor [Treponema sp.]